MFKRKKEAKIFEEPTKRSENVIYIGDCPFEILKENKYNIILYNASYNNLIITDNHNKTLNDITDIFYDPRFNLLYFKITKKHNLVIVIRSDEGLTNDYLVFEGIDLSSVLSNKISFKAIYDLIKGKKAIFSRIK